jgi:hypothetical protein
LALAAVVVTVIVELVVVSVPVLLTVGTLKLQLASEGSPEQASVIVPVNPPEETTDTEVEPEDPGAEIETKAPRGIEAKKPGEIVNVIGGVLLLAAKLASLG